MTSASDISLVDSVFCSEELVRGFVQEVRRAYRESRRRAADYGPWDIAKAGIAHDRRAMVEGRLFDLTKTIPEVRPVILDNSRKTHPFLGLQVGQLLILPCRTSGPEKLPRRANIRCRLAQSPQLSYFEPEPIGFDASFGEPLLAILSHGPMKADPTSSAWVRVVIPDTYFRHSVHSIDLLARYNTTMPHSNPEITEVPAVKPRLRQSAALEEISS